MRNRMNLNRVRFGRRNWSDWLSGALVAVFCINSAPFSFAAAAETSNSDWEQTLAAAKKEGEIAIYGSRGYEKVFELFNKKYPEIKVNALTGLRGSEYGQKVMTEHRAGKYLVDLFINGVVTPNTVFYKANLLEPIRPHLMLTEVVDESKWWNGKHHYADPEDKYIFVFQGNIHGGEAAYNTKLVNPKEIDSYWDFLDPKWKGKIVAFDPKRISTVAHSMRFFFNNPDLGSDFVRKFFGSTDITFSRDERQIIDWLGSGQYAVAFFVSEIRDAAKQGLPVKFFDPSSFKEGAFLGPTQGGVSLFKNAPHPNAAKVAINWLLSKEGQTAYQTIYAQLHDVRESMREDIPKDVIPAEFRRVKGAKYIYSGRPEWLDMKPVIKLVQEARQGGKKK